MNTRHPLSIALISTTLLVGFPLQSYTSDSLQTIQLPPSPLPEIHAMLDQRQQAKEEIRAVQLRAKTLIAQAQEKLNSARDRTDHSDQQFRNNWNRTDTSLEHLDQAAQQYETHSARAQETQETMREIFIQSEMKIDEINQKIKQVEQEIEAIRLSWVQKHGTKLMAIAQQTQQEMSAVQTKITGEVLVAQGRLNQTQLELSKAQDQLQQIMIKAREESLQFADWVATQQEIAKKAESQSGKAWHSDSGSYGEMEQEATWAKAARNRAELANSQSLVVTGLIEAEIAVAQARVESLQAQRMEEKNRFNTVQTQGEEEMFTEEQQLIQTLTTLAQGPLQYTN
ncbi:MAG: hypothetical protein HQL72_08680 [Magnetococcales bacterium]|nr:hypothetical protein [Magnetococcales bacterium]